MISSVRAVWAHKRRFFLTPSKIYTRCFKTRGVELFAITLSAVNRFWKFFHCWNGNNNELSAKQIWHSSPLLKTSLYYRVKHNSLKMLQLLYRPITPWWHSCQLRHHFSKFFKHLKKHVTFLAYLLPLPAARACTSHDSRVHNLEEVLYIWHGLEQSTVCASSRLRTCQRRTFWALAICLSSERSLKQWSNVPKSWFFFVKTNKVKWHLI